MFLGFINTKISNKNKLLSLSNLLLFYQPLPFWGKNVPSPIFWRINRTPILISFLTCGRSGYDWSKLLVSQFLSLQKIISIIMQTFNFRFQNVSFTKLPPKILMIRHVTDKVIINLKWRKCCNFFKPSIKGNIKYKKSFNFLLIFII